MGPSLYDDGVYDLGSEKKWDQLNGADGPSDAASPKMPLGLCHICEALDITPGSFIIANHGSGDGPTLARPFTFAKRSHGAEGKPAVMLRSGTGDVKLGTVSELTKRGCRLCRLVVKSIKSFNKPYPSAEARAEAEENTVCTIRWEVDGREALTPFEFSNRTRRLRLMWSLGSLPVREAFLLFVVRTNALFSTSDALPFQRQGQTFLGREVNHETGKQALIKSWLDLCHEYHGPVCKTKVTQLKEFRKLINETYFGVIDVVDMQLKPLPWDSKNKPAKYAALSYVWGSMEKIHATVRSNAPDRCQHGGLAQIKQMPKVIQDAISLVQKLGLRYLWVDALCIVQDSASSFKLNAQVMHTIYGNAHFTICAADGNDAETGFVAMSTRADSISGEQLTNDIPTREQLTEKSVPYEQLSEEVVPGVQLQVCRPPEMVIQDSKWNARGWTFQERILSRRCIIFAEGRAYFQCRKAAMSEDIHNDPTGSGWSLQSMGAPLRSVAEIEFRALSFYMKSVGLFYRRELTRRGDILAAYRGIEAVLEKVMQAPFCFGLPTSHFDFALLWQPIRAGRRRTLAKLQHDEGCAQKEGGLCSCKVSEDDLGGLEFPSWSWCGWVGGDVGYDPNALEGTLLNVREWLRRRTWVRWYIRDGRGKLRRIWDRNQVFEDESLESRWRGYAGLQRPEEATIPSRRSSSSDESVEESRERRKRRERARPDVGEGFGFLLKSRKPPTRPREAIVLWDEAEDRRTSSSHDEYEGDDQSTVISSSESEVGSRRRSARTARQLDSWGRRPRREFAQAPRDEFHLIHPETPWRVKKTEFTTMPSDQFPDMPVLQFWTPHMRFSVIKTSDNEETKLSRCDIGDSAGDWCGTITLNTDWIETRDGYAFDFIAISEAKAFTVDEHPDWNYYVPRERGESEWDIYYVLLIVKDKKKHVWERVGLGKVFKNAFNGAIWDEIMLG